MKKNIVTNSSTLIIIKRWFFIIFGSTVPLISKTILTVHLWIINWNYEINKVNSTKLIK